MISISVDASEPKHLAERIGERAHDYRIAFEAMRQYLRTAYSANFMPPGGGGVGGWAPLRPSTAAWKAREGLPPATMHGKTNSLMDSLSTLMGTPNDIGAKTATFGTDVKYAHFHQYGTPNMAKRELVFEPTGFGAFSANRIAAHLLPEDGVIGLVPGL
jgi:phage gpG-like protein